VNRTVGLGEVMIDGRDVAAEGDELSGKPS
jgi:uncharacterized Zn-binding protein involved in type VI secretion